MQLEIIILDVLMDFLVSQMCLLLPILKLYLAHKSISVHYILENGGHFEFPHGSYYSQMKNSECNWVNGLLGITNMGIATIFTPLHSPQGKILNKINWKTAAILKFKFEAEDDLEKNGTYVF